MTRRLFFRKMTKPSGVSISNDETSDETYRKWFTELIDQFVLPMQERVYPKGTVIRNNREVILKDGDSYLRTLGTCPIRIRVKKVILHPYGYYDVVVRENCGYRLLEGQIVNLNRK